jgi:hypothetical protein
LRNEEFIAVSLDFAPTTGTRRIYIYNRENKNVDTNYKPAISQVNHMRTKF